MRVLGRRTFRVLYLMRQDGLFNLISYGEVA